LKIAALHEMPILFSVVADVDCSKIGASGMVTSLAPLPTYEVGESP